MNDLTKVCFKCNEEKTLDNFYRHKKMSLGVVNKCKECNKKDVIDNYKKKSKDIDFIEKERERSREKYHRLNYKEKQVEWNKRRTWTKSSKYKNLSRKLNPPKGIELHHWSYNEKHLEDVIYMDKFEHRKLHTYIKLDYETKFFMYKDLLLDTKEKHIEFIENLKK